MVDTGALGHGKMKKTRYKNQRAFAGGNTPKPIRLPEEVMRIWMAPHQDEKGNYHGEKYVYAVVKPSQWLGLEKG